MVNIVALRWLFSPIFTICLVRSWWLFLKQRQDHGRRGGKAQAHALRHLRRRQAAVHGVHGRSSRVGGRAAAQGGGKGWKSGQIVGDFEGFYSKNCRDDQEISRFWWNWIGNMWIYHDLSGNMCYLRWLTTKLGWGAGAQTLSIPGGVSSTLMTLGFGGQKIRAAWGKSFWEALATKRQTSRCFMLMAFSGTSFGHIPFDSPCFSSRLGLNHHTGWHLDHV